MPGRATAPPGQGDGAVAVPLGAGPDYRPPIFARAPRDAQPPAGRPVAAGGAPLVGDLWSGGLIWLGRGRRVWSRAPW